MDTDSRRNLDESTMYNKTEQLNKYLIALRNSIYTLEKHKIKVLHSKKQNKGSALLRNKIKNKIGLEINTRPTAHQCQAP